MSSKEFDERLEQIFFNHENNCFHEFNLCTHGVQSKNITLDNFVKRRQEAKAAVRELIGGGLGEDKAATGYMRPQGYMNVDLTESYRNVYRAELREVFGITKEGE